MRTHNAKWMMMWSLTLLWTGCWSNDNGPIQLPPDPDPAIGQTDFLSADGQEGQQSERNALDGASQEYDTEAPAAGDDKSSTRTVEEGDIYRVLGDSYLLNLNAYRGLQVIDMSDVANPAIVGRFRVSGSPVEMYVVGTTAVVLLNNYQGYYGSRDDIQVESYQGGLVLTIDIANPTAPHLVSQARVPGSILTSRLTRGGGGQAVYVAANQYRYYTYGYDEAVSSGGSETETVVRSFSISAGGELAEKTTIELGGYVQDIQATTEALLVARYDWNSNQSTVALIDISDPLGAMIEGAEIQTFGRVQHKSNMDLYKNVLRVVSGAWWQDSEANHLQTFDVSDIQHPQAIDHQVFGAGENLYATLFLGNKAFFVTYRQVDPLHAFFIDDAGQASPRAEYEITGWNDFFKPVLSDTRLIGIGTNDEQGWTMAVSLYDTDLENHTPFIARADVAADNSWSEASWDDKAFSVLEDAVSVTAANGSVETGLVLLPFTGYDSTRQSYVAAVQIFTFSNNSLTRRGVMEHGSYVRRSFVAKGDTTANLSESALSLFDTATPDAPAELGKVELAPNYTDFLVFGAYGARLKYDRDDYWWWGASAEIPDNQVEIIPLAADPDTAEPLAVIDIPAAAQVYQVGDRLAVVETVYVPPADQKEETTYETTIQVYDLSDPTRPRAAGRLVTDQIQPYYRYWYYDMRGGAPEAGMAVDECIDCGGYYPSYYGSPMVHAVGDALVFAANVWEQELLGNEHVCSIYPKDRYYYDKSECAWLYNGDESQEVPGDASCTYYTGVITCTSLNGAPKTCTGSLQQCTVDADYNHTCQEIDPGSIATEEYCYDYDRYRTWSHFDLNVLDLRQADEPDLLPTLSMPKNEQAVSLLPDGRDLYLSYSIPVRVANDSRSFVRYYFKRVDLSDPGDPEVGPGINVPGQLIAVDGSTVYTRDFVWGENVVESAINKLAVHGALAELLARKRFPDRQVNSMLLDGQGHALVSHALSWWAIDNDPALDWEDQNETLTVLDTSSSGFRTLSEFEVDRWASLRDARAGRALFSVSGGLLVVNLDDPAKPYAQAYFPTLGWPTSLLVHGDQITFAAGRYGMYRFGLNEFNLQSAP